MPDRNVVARMKELSARAAVRQIARPAIKTSSDAKVENANFRDLRDQVYKEITKER